jgi:hypothetical protein
MGEDGEDSAKDEEAEAPSKSNLAYWKGYGVVVTWGTRACDMCCLSVRS